MMDWIIDHYQEILFFLAIIDVVVGALPQSWVKYTGVVLNIANGLRKLDIKKAGTALSVLLCFLVLGCFEVNPDAVPQETECDRVTDSWICETIHEKGWDPAKMRDLIIDVDLAALAVSDRYNKVNALEYTARIREYAYTDISYEFLVRWMFANADKIKEEYRGAATGGIILLSRRLKSFTSVELIRDDDWQVILALLDKVDAEVNRYF